MPRSSLWYAGRETKKRKASWANSRSCTKRRAWVSAWPSYGDSECYDFILDSGERFWRVQVKSIYGHFRRVYRAQAQHNSGRRYKAEEIDFVVAYVVPRDAWYVIPVNCVAASASMAFYPSGCRKGAGRYECYREAWLLMAPSGLARVGSIPDCLAMNAQARTPRPGS